MKKMALLSLTAPIIALATISNAVAGELFKLPANQSSVIVLDDSKKYENAKAAVEMFPDKVVRFDQQNQQSMNEVFKKLELILNAPLYSIKILSIEATLTNFSALNVHGQKIYCTLIIENEGSENYEEMISLHCTDENKSKRALSLVMIDKSGTPIRHLDDNTLNELEGQKVDPDSFDAYTLKNLFETGSKIETKLESAANEITQFLKSLGKGELIESSLQLLSTRELRNKAIFKIDLGEDKPATCLAIQRRGVLACLRPGALDFSYFGVYHQNLKRHVVLKDSL